MYMDNSKVIIEKADTSRFQHIAVSCVMSVGGCKFKMSNWQRAINCCLEVLERDSSNTKALYHKIQVWQRLKEFDQPLAVIIIDQCLIQSSSEKPPQVTDGNTWRGPQPDITWRESINGSLHEIPTLRAQGIPQKRRLKTVRARGDRGQQKNRPSE